MKLHYCKTLKDGPAEDNGTLDYSGPKVFLFHLHLPSLCSLLRFFYQSSIVKANNGHYLSIGETLMCTTLRLSLIFTLCNASSNDYISIVDLTPGLTWTLSLPNITP